MLGCNAGGALTKSDPALRPRPISPLDNRSYSPKFVSAPSLRTSRSAEEEQSEPPDASPARLSPPKDAIPLPAKKLAQPALGLNEVIAACIAGDPRIRAGWEEVEQATGDYITASLPPNPNLAVTGSLLPLTRPFTVDRQGGPPQLDVWIGYPLDWFVFGKQAAAKATKSSGVRVIEAEYEDLIRQRIRAAGLAYFDVLEARATLELAQDDWQRLQEIESLYKKSAEAALKGERELNLIPLERAQANRAVREAEAKVKEAQAQVRALMGQFTNQTGLEVAGSLAIPKDAHGVSIEDAFALAQQSRADLQAQRERITQAQFSVFEEKRKACPDLTARVGYTRQYQTKAVGFPDANAWGAEVEMSLPFFDRNQGNRRKADSTLLKNQQLLSAFLFELNAEMERVVEEHRTTLETARSITLEQVKQAHDTRDAYIKAMGAGVRSLFDVVEAHRNYRDLSRIFVYSRANYARAAVRLNAAVGKQLVP